MADAHAHAPTPAAWLGQALLYALFALIVGVFSTWPTYHHLPPGEALIKLSISHQAKPVGECRKPTDEENAKLAPNMRKPLICPRERSPITIELDVDGRPALRQVAQPSGLRRDGAAAMYHRMQVAAGEHRVAVRMKDDARTPGFDYQREATVTLRPAQILVIDFDPAEGGITLQ